MKYLSLGILQGKNYDVIILFDIYLLSENIYESYCVYDKLYLHRVNNSLVSISKYFGITLFDFLVFIQRISSLVSWQVRHALEVSLELHWYESAFLSR